MGSRLKLFQCFTGLGRAFAQTACPMRVVHDLAAPAQILNGLFNMGIGLRFLGHHRVIDRIVHMLNERRGVMRLIAILNRLLRLGNRLIDIALGEGYLRRGERSQRKCHGKYNATTVHERLS